jgi:penicillin-binding protein 1A
MWFAIAGLCAAVLSLAGMFLYLDPQVPDAASYRQVKLETPLRVYSEDGALLAEFGERRLIPVALEQVPQQFIDALLNTEDKRFYEHSGIDFISLANDTVALVGSLLFTGENTPGASTITMQLARNISFTLDRRFLRKFKEMLLALKLERELTKDEILELYINMAPFGKRAYGAQAAAFTYYGKPLDQLNLAQLAMLAGIPQRPSAANPINGPTQALARREVVLTLMRGQESISETDYRNAMAAPITAKVFERDLDVASPYAAEWVRQQAFDLFPDLYTGGYEVFTTIDSRAQRAAINALRAGLETYDQRHGYRGPEDRLGDDLVAQLSAIDIATVAVDDGATTKLVQLPEEVASAIQSRLADMPTHGGDLHPAVVVAVTDERALATMADDRQIEIALADAGWARPYIDVDLRGPKPKSFDEIVAVGDLIRVSPNDDGWELSQLPEIEGAIVSMEPATGKVRALVGGYDFYRNQYNHALQAARQPGSGFKPFVYSTALANGVTPADIFMDAPLVFDDENLESEYRPGNDNSRFNGPTRLRQALYSSINLVSIRVLLEIGAGSVLDYVPNFGFSTSTFPRNTQLAIGGGTMAVTPIDMVRGYSVFANGGFLVDPYVVDYVKNYDGEVIFRSNHPVVCQHCDEHAPDVEALQPEVEPATLEDLLAERPQQDMPTALDDLAAADTAPAEATESDSSEVPDEDTPSPWDQLEPVEAPRVIDERNAYIMHTMLQDVIKRGTGRRARVLKRGDLAGKTGTTNEAADTWFNGYTSGLATTVWVGFSDHAPLGANAYGSNTPLPIWIEMMDEVLEGREESTRAQPPGVVTLKIDPKTGKPARPGQSSAIFEYFLREFAPKQTEVGDTQQPAEDTEIKAIDLF